MASERYAGGPAAPFSEKGFYLSEFRGRTLALAAAAGVLAETPPLEAVLKELEANGTRVLLISTERAALQGLLGTRVLPASAGRLEMAVWRGFAEAPRLGLLVDEAARLPARAREIALQLGISKLVWLDAAGGIAHGDGRRDSFVDLAGLREHLRDASAREGAERVQLLGEIERALEAGIPAVNLCTAAGLADELFTYAGSGTLFTRERYVTVRRFVLDDYDAAHDLIARGTAEGYLAPRSQDEMETVLASGFGAFVEGHHLAGIGALLEVGDAGEIASLYTLTRFLGEGIGRHLLGFACDRARERGFGYVFACTTSERVARFFEREGFRRVGQEDVPAEKWCGYDPARRDRAICVRREPV